MAPSDADLARLAGRLRVLTYGQLLEAGLTRSGIRCRLDAGRLQRPWDGVYVVGPAPPHPLCLAQAAVATTGDRGHLSHGWARYGWGLGPVPELPVDVTVASGSRSGRPGAVRVHLSKTLDHRDRATRHGIPTLSPARMLLDVAPAVTGHELERLVADAQVAKLLTEHDIRELVARCGRHAGVRRLRAVITERPGLTRAESERILRRLLRKAGLPQPETDAPLLGSYRADFLFRQHGLIVEVDGYGPHGHRRAFRTDRRRTSMLAAAGYTVMPLTWWELVDEPLSVVARIAEALARRAPAT
jgi:very-short-patch-repair endonuclease